VEQKVSLLDKLNAKLKMQQETGTSSPCSSATTALAASMRLSLNSGASQPAARIHEAKVTSGQKADEPERKEWRNRLRASPVARLMRSIGRQLPAGRRRRSVGSTVYDGSVRGLLDRLREELTSA